MANLIGYLHGKNTAAKELQLKEIESYCQSYSHRLIGYGEALPTDSDFESLNWTLNTVAASAEGILFFNAPPKAKKQELSQWSERTGKSVLVVKTKASASPKPVTVTTEVKKETSIITLRQVWRDYTNLRALKDKTLYDYEKKLKAVEDWMDIDMNSITKNMIEERHRSLSAAPYYANSIFRIIRTLYNHAIIKYEDDETGISLIKRNPVKRLTEARAWFKEKPRSRMVPLNRLQDWFCAVLLLENPVIRDYLIFCLLTGFRKEEAAQLTWDDVDFIGGYVTVPAQRSKNGEEHRLPTSPYLLELLKERRADPMCFSRYVFPGGRWISAGPISSPYKAIAQVTKSCGVKFSPHDLRRTFVALAEDVGLDFYVRKRLVNHTFDDVTAVHYSVKNPERLREPMQRITKRAMELAGLNCPGTDAEQTT